MNAHSYVNRDTVRLGYKLVLFSLCLIGLSNHLAIGLNALLAY